MTRTKVWLVEVNDGSGWFTAGIYSTEQGAEERAKELLDTYPEIEITEMVLDEAHDFEEETP